MLQCAFNSCIIREIGESVFIKYQVKKNPINKSTVLFQFKSHRSVKIKLGDFLRKRMRTSPFLSSLICNFIKVILRIVYFKVLSKLYLNKKH